MESGLLERLVEDVLVGASGWDSRLVFCVLGHTGFWF
jgi:hypothetical protein